MYRTTIIDEDGTTVLKCTHRFDGYGLPVMLARFYADSILKNATIKTESNDSGTPSGWEKVIKEGTIEEIAREVL